MLLGGYGPGARAAVERAARRAGLEITREGPLTLGASPGSVMEGNAGAYRIWLTGRVSVDELQKTLRGEWPSAAQAVATGFDRLGAGAQRDVHGAYILVSLDRARQVVRISHDHLGARPVTYAARGADTFFAEHLVDLLALLPSTPSPDRLSVVQWIDTQTLPAGRSLLSGIVRLPSGAALELSPVRTDVREFWRPVYRDPVRLPAGSGETVAGAALAAVQRSTRGLRQPAVKLSGGLDSACVAAGLAAQGWPALAFARTFPDHPTVDESDLIRQTASMTGLRLVEIPYRDTAIIPPMGAYIRRWALPPISPNLMIWPPLMAAARDAGVDGLLDGEGGDGLFGMWPHLIADRLRHGDLLTAWRLAGRLPGLGERPGRDIRIRALRVFGVGAGAPLWSQRLRRKMRDPRDGISQFVRDSDVPGLIAHDDRWAWKRGDGPLWWRSAVDVLIALPERLDANGHLARDAQDAGVDRRHPFLHDSELVEAMLQVAPEQQFDPFRDRPVLRDGLAGRIPEAIRTRYTKVVFNEVSGRALRGREGATLLQQISSPAAPVREYVRSQALESLAGLPAATGSRGSGLAGNLFRLAGLDSWLSHLADLPDGPSR